VDVAIWIHPTDVRQSVVIGTDRSAGLLAYGLDGQQLSSALPGHMNSVDLRYNFPLDGGAIPLIGATNQFDNTLALYTIDPVLRTLQGVPTLPPTLFTGTNVLGLSMYRSNSNGSYYAFVTDTDGGIQQWGLAQDGGRVMGNVLRTLALGSQAQGIVSDDAYGALYVAEDLVGIWKYSAEPDAGVARVLVDAVDGGHLVARVKGLSIYRARNGAGYLLASSQGSATVAVYGREPPNRFLVTFQVDGGSGRAIPANGLDVTNFGLDGGFPEGLLVLQDSQLGLTNFKLVSWGAIARAYTPPLVVDTLLDPRQVETFDGGLDAGTGDGGVDGGGGGGTSPPPGGGGSTSTGCSCTGGPSGVLVVGLGVMALAFVRSRKRRDRE
jgi:3-phytase